MGFSNHLLDRRGKQQTIESMYESQKHPNVPATYSEHFGQDEFKFRWVDALALIMEKWRTPSSLFVAYVLSSRMNLSGECYLSIPKMAKRMRVSTKTARRAINTLEAEGWLLVMPRPGRTNIFNAILPQSGLDVLLADREEKKLVPDSDDWAVALMSVLSAAITACGSSISACQQEKDWSRVVGSVNQLIRRMGGPFADLSLLEKFLLREVPQHVVSPTGFLLEKLAQFRRMYPSFTGEKGWIARSQVSDIHVSSSVITSTGSRLMRPMK